MNANLLRTLVDRHAPDSVKQQLLKLDELTREKRALRKREKRLEYEILTGRKPTDSDGKCHVCGVEDPLLQHEHRNGHETVVRI